MAICEKAVFFKTTEGDIYAQVPVNSHRKVIGVGERGGFRQWLLKRYFQEYGSAASTTALQQCIELVIATANEEAPTHPLFIRVGHKGDKIYLDMANDKRQVIEIDAAGWRILDESPVYFRRSPGMLPLPIPERGGNIDHLKPFFNIQSDDEWRMIVAFELMMLHPTGPYPVLALSGEEGSTKSSATLRARGVIDPHIATARPAPKDKTDLNVATQHNWAVCFENLSSIPQWLSDSLCRLSTGHADGGRKLYTDGDEKLFVAKRPVIFNGIGDLVTRSDLLSRTLTIKLPAMANGKYKSEEDLNKAWTAAHPGILGAVLDIVSTAIGNRPNTNVQYVSRMSDMEHWLAAAAPALGWQKDDFSKSCWRYSHIKTLLANETMDGNGPVWGPKTPCMTCKNDKNGLVLTIFHAQCHSPTKS